MKVINWHKRNVGNSSEFDASVYVCSTHSEANNESAQVCIKREDGSSMSVTFTPKEFLQFAEEVAWCSSRWSNAAQHGVQPNDAAAQNSDSGSVGRVIG